jgi:transposase
MAAMRGDDRQPRAMFSYVSAEERVPQDHPLRAIRTFVDEILAEMTREFDALYAQHGRPSIPPERSCARSCCSCSTRFGVSGC